jgi:hypothetical protein
MYLHANAKLGLAGRLALVRAIEDGLSLKAPAAAYSVSPAAAHRWWHRWLEGGRLPQSLLDPSSQPRRSPRRRGDRDRAFDRLEGAATTRPLPSPAKGQGAGQQLRVALSRRSAAHGHQPLRALPAARASCHRRPLTALSQLDAARDEGRLRLRARDRRRPLPPRLRRAPRRRASRHCHRLRRTSPRLLRVPRHPHQTTDDRQRLQLRQEPLAARAARLPRHPPLTTEPYRPRTKGKVERFHQTMARE